MGKLIPDLFGYDLLKICSKRKPVCWKTNVYKEITSKDRKLDQNLFAKLVSEKLESFFK